MSSSCLAPLNHFSLLSPSPPSGAFQQREKTTVRASFKKTERKKGGGAGAGEKEKNAANAFQTPI